MSNTRSLSDLLVVGYKYQSPRFCWALSYYLTLHGQKVKKSISTPTMEMDIMEAQEMMYDCEVICPTLNASQLAILVKIGKSISSTAGLKVHYTRITDEEYNTLSVAGEEWVGRKIMFKNGAYRYILNMDSKNGYHSVVVRRMAI